MIVYLLFIAPLELLMGYIFVHVLQVTHIYSMSILVLSLVVNILLLPLYHMAEKWQNAERAIQAKMKDELILIKKSFVKSERMAMINTVYKIHGYHPIKAVRNSFGFLIQVPFFFAAYHFLSHYHYVNTQLDFGFFQNIAEPDQLLKIGALRINVMPFIMTAINLFSAFVYTKHLQRRDKIQLVGLALLFLVVLYNSPFALVWYWTLNNVFSLLKNMVYHYVETHQELIKRIKDKRAAMVEKVTTPEGIQSLLRDIAVLGLIAVTIFLITYGWFNPHSYPIIVSLIAYWAVITILHFVFIYKKRKGQKRTWASYLKHGLGLICIALIVVSIVMWAVKEGFPALLARRNLLCSLILLNLVYGHTFLQYCYTSITSRIKTNLPLLFFTCLTLLVSLVYWYMPVTLFHFAPYNFDFTLSSMIEELIPMMVLTWLCIVFINYLLPKKLKTTVQFFGIVITIAGLAYAFVFKGNYGFLMGIALSETGELYSFNIYKDVIIIFAVAVIIGLILFSKYARLFSNLVMLLVVVSFLGGGFYYFTTEKKTENVTAKIATNTNKITHSVVSFSKTHKNVAVFMLDDFTGEFIGEMLKEKYKYLDEYSGFTWYADSTTAGIRTYPGLFSILGGLKHTAYKQTQNPQKTIVDQYRENYNRLTTLFHKNNYEVSLLHNQYTSFEGWTPKACKVSFYFDNCVPYLYDKRFNYTQMKDNFYKGLYANVKTIFMSMTSLFKLAPYSLRQFVYDGGDWSVISDDVSTPSATASGMFLHYLPNTADVKATRPTFKFYHLMLTHEPFLYNPKTCMPALNNKDRSYISDYTLKTDREIPTGAHYATTLCAIRMLSKFLVWLKANNIYDNTKIILVSDHSEGDDTISAAYLAKHHLVLNIASLLLVKDFNAKNKKIKVNKDIFTTNADVPAIAAEGLKGAVELYGPNILKHPIKRKEIYTVRAESYSWSGYNLKTFKGGRVFKIKNSVLDANNIEEIEPVK